MFRCPWAQSDLSVPYHDTEWGVLRLLRLGDRGAHRCPASRKVLDRQARAG
jgi:hypothetical protein